MSKFSRRGESLIGQEMFTILDRAAQMEREGQKVYHLELGDPRIPPPASLLQDAADSLLAGRVGYCSSSGAIGLRDAVADYLRVPVECVAISPANLLISQFLDIVADPGDRVCLFAPAFPTYLAASQMIGLDVRLVALKPPEFDLTFEKIDEAMEHNPKAIIVNSGCNPTGAIYDSARLGYLLNRCRKRNTWLLSDETYGTLCLWEKYYRPAKYSVDLMGLEPLSRFPFKKYDSLIFNGDRTFTYLAVISSLSKVMAVPGFRLGYIAASPEMISKITLSSSTLYSCLPIPLQVAMQRTIQRGDLGVFAKKLQIYYADIMDQCLSILDNSILSVHRPQAGFYLWIDVSRTGMDASTFVRQALEQVHVAVTQGAAFGWPEGYVRAAVCGEREDVIEGITRLVRFAG